MIARLLSISGRVQGVGYRDWLVREALRLGLRGWVRNRPDRSVQALVAGDAAAVQALIAACHRGPLLARVAAVAEAPAEVPEAPGFHRRADG